MLRIILQRNVAREGDAEGVKEIVKVVLEVFEHGGPFLPRKIRK